MPREGRKVKLKHLTSPSDADECTSLVTLKNQHCLSNGDLMNIQPDHLFKWQELPTSEASGMRRSRFKMASMSAISSNSKQQDHHHTTKFCQHHHQVPNMKTTAAPTKMHTRAHSRRSVLTSVIILILAALASSWLQQCSPSDSLVAAASTSPSDVSQLAPPPAQTSQSTATANASSTLPAVSIISNQQLKQRQPQAAQATFSTPNQAINITHVTYDPLHDTVYLGATNTIYQLNGSDLSVQYEQSTGPVYDNPSCGITECHGFEDNMKLTQDINKVLVIDYQHKKLLSCGSTKQGACRRYQLDDIAQKEDLIPMAVAANDDNSTTYAFVAPARYNTEPAGAAPPSAASGSNPQQQQVLYVASTYTKVGQSRELLVPAIGTRTLDEGPNLLKLYENSFVDSRIDINSHLRDYFLVNYMYGFASSNHIYFVTVQKKATTRDFEELGYHTRLARICITDSSYNSYTEVDLKCVPNKRRSNVHQTNKHANYFTGQQQQSQASSEQPNDYPLLQDAILVDAGSQLLQSLAQSDQLPSNFFAAAGSSPDDNKVLLGVFSSARDHTQYAGDHSALCAFSLAQIEDKFNDNINSCYTGKMQSRNMEYIAGNVQECPKSGQGGNVVNFCHETLKINGTIPIVSEAAAQYYNTTLTAITATAYVNTQAKNIYSEQLSSELTSEQVKRDSALGKNTAKTNNVPRQHTVVFAGTSSGHIKKILLNNASNGVEFEDVQLDTQPILSDLHLHSSGDQLIAATPYKVFKVPTHNCGQYGSCRECSQSRNPYCGWCLLKRSCTSKSECVPAATQQPSIEQRSIASLQETASGGSSSNQLGSASKQHNQQQPKWISAESSGKCIDLQSISPDKIPMTSAGKVDLYIDRLPRLPREHSYRCVFNRSEQTTATATQFGLSCPLPKLMDRQRHIQIEPGRDHAVVELAVRSSETNTDFLDGKVTFFDCQRHTTCKDCLTTNWGCNWCLNENVCLFNTSKCEKTTGGGGSQQQRQDSSPLQILAGPGQSQRSRQQTGPIVVGPTSGSSQQRGSTLISNSGTRTSNTISLVQQCPTFDVGHQQDILIADGSERELSIRVKNMPQFKGAMKCIVEIENFEISLRAQVQEDRVICENSTYSYAADVGLLNAQLKVIYSDSNIYIDRTNFTMYKCHLLGAYLNRPDCSLCQRIDPRFNCGWCGGSCQYRARCLERPDEKCPPPRIDFVHPLSGPILGGTRVTIEGSNLGQSFEEIANRVSIGNSPCKPIEDEYRPSNRIICLTGPAMGASLAGRGAHHVMPTADSIPGDIAVGNRAGYTIGLQKFQFKPIFLRDHQPRYGPQSGGTRLTLTGLNLNIGSSVQVFLDELPCLVEMSSLTSEHLSCRTSPSRQSSRPIRQLKLIIDDAQIVRDDDVFYYTSDPIISRLSPLRAYLSGGRPINVFGANLTVVQTPRMAIHDMVTGKKINESLCILQDDTRMQCPAPAVNLQMMDLEYAEQQAGILSSYEPNAGQTIPSTGSAWSPQQMTRGNSAAVANQQQQMLQQDESIRFKLSFIMDNVLQTSFPQLQTEIAYTGDPKLYPFASEQYRTLQEVELISSSINGQLNNEQARATTTHNYQIESDTFLLLPGEPTLTLHGENLKAAVSEYEITVTVGQDLCNLTQLSSTRLVCVMPLDHMASPTDEDGHPTQRALPLVVVRIGFNLRYELGYVQYHPTLLAQIVSLIANLTAANNAPSTASPWGTQPMRFPPSYVPRENESPLHRISSLLFGTFMMASYALLVIVLAGLVYISMIQGLRLKERAKRSRAYKHQLAKFESLERSLKDDCRVASLALQGDLNELVRHIELSGIPLLSTKQYIMKVFFPGINNHPLLVRSGVSTCGNNSAATMLMMEPHQHQSVVNSHAAGAMGASAKDLPMEHFERLLLTKPFLVSFINTLEQQPSFTIRDKVNVASLLMIVLMERLDYATDIMRTLLFQLVQRSVSQLNQTSGPEAEVAAYELEAQLEDDFEEVSVVSKTTRRLTRRASNLLSGLPISKRSTPTRMAASQLGKVVNGSASSLMASTSVAAQMLLARVGHKTSPMGELNTPVAYYQQQQYSTQATGSPLDCHTVGANGNVMSNLGSEYMSTTTFNNSTANNKSHGGHPCQHSTGRSRRQSSQCASSEIGRSSMSYRNRHAKASAKDRRFRCKRQAQLMLRKTDSIVEKMLTNWLALNMHDHLQGPLGKSLYLLFEALRCQLERGPIDAISGDAYYSLSEHKLLREPTIQFEIVNLYVIVDTDILETDTRQLRSQQQQQPNLLLDNGCHQEFADNAAHLDPQMKNNRNNRFNTTNNRQQTTYSPGNTITLGLRVLDCDTISQVKGKILNALYKNLPQSSRVRPNDVELSLRRHQPHNGHQTLSAVQHNHMTKQQYVTIMLADDDFSSMNSYQTSARRLNTLRHYGIIDQAILLMKRNVNQQASNPSANTIEDHYSSPYAEIQYGHCVANSAQPLRVQPLEGANQRQHASGNAKAWHLIKSDIDRTSAHLSEHSNECSSSPASHSPSMMLLGGSQAHGDGNNHQNSNRTAVSNTLLQQFYHPSSSSTSSTGNVMDTHSTSANSSSMMNVNSIAPRPQQHRPPVFASPNLITQQQDHLQQPIYCQIGSISAQSQHGANCNVNTAGSQYYCQINPGTQAQAQPAASNQHMGYIMAASSSSASSMTRAARNSDASSSERENSVYLARMLSSKGTIQKYIDNFFETILTARPTPNPNSMSHSMQLYEEMTPVVFASDQSIHQMATGSRRKHLLEHQSQVGACPPAVKWVFDLLDEAAIKNGISDQTVIHAWKSNAFLLRFWVNFIKNPDYFLDVDKTNTLDASLSTIAHTLMDACTPSEDNKSRPVREGDYNRLIFSRDSPKYKDMVKRFYQDIASMRPISDQEMIEQMSFLSMGSTSDASGGGGGGKFDTNLALKELCVYAVNYGVEIMNTLNGDYTCQQMELSQQLEQCFRSFTIFEAYQ